MEETTNDISTLTEKLRAQLDILDAESWKGEFRRDTNSRRKAVAELHQILLRDLPGRVEAFKSELHPSHSMTVSSDRTTVTISDGDPRELARCHIHLGEAAGALHLQLFQRGVSNEAGETLTLMLDRLAQQTYVWHSTRREEILPAELPDYILYNLLLKAVAAVRRETPKDQV